jgi:hypothetical protein
VPWLEQFPNHHLRSLSTDWSDHAPLLLQLNSMPWPKPRFRFEAFWTRQEGFAEVVQQAWSIATDGVDACRALDQKLRHTAKALKHWSAKHIGRNAWGWRCCPAPSREAGQESDSSRRGMQTPNSSTCRLVIEAARTAFPTWYMMGGASRLRKRNRI